MGVGHWPTPSRPLLVQSDPLELAFLDHSTTPAALFHRNPVAVTRFYVRLSGRYRKMRGAAIMGDLYGRVILVAEEEYFIADNVARVLEQLGADGLGPVSTLGGALTLLEVLDRVDGAVLDINLHDEAVQPLLDALEARGIPYVFAIDDGEAAIPTQYQDVPRWTKPYQLEDLVTQLGAFSRR